MGQLLSICSDGNESEKPKLLADVPNDESECLVVENKPEGTLSDAQQQHSLETEGSERALREEQARLELIVSTAGRDMVAVRSTRANPGYYDQGFAAALAQHLQEQIPTSQLRNTLPAPSSSADIYAILNKSPSIANLPENPNSLHDHVSEYLLASMVPTKEHVFAQVEPMIENLL